MKILKLSYLYFESRIGVLPGFFMQLLLTAFRMVKVAELLKGIQRHSFGFHACQT
jgi:hypothetical protein